MTAVAIAGCVERARDASAPAARRHEAFEELVRAFEAMALASADRLLHDPEAASDAVQDAFLAAWLNLDQLRAPAAFGGWLKRLVGTECQRRLRARRFLGASDERGMVPETLDRPGPDWPLDRALAALTEAERHALVLFHLYGCSLDEIAAGVGAPRATIGKRLYAARLKIRRTLPSSVRASVLRMRAHRPQPGPDALAEYVGVYRFETRPELLVEIRRSRRGDALISRSRGQENRLIFVGDDTLATRCYDGEGRFQRDGRGRVTRFVYYEFGARLGVARRIDLPRPVGPQPRARPLRPEAAGRAREAARGARAVKQD